METERSISKARLLVSLLLAACAVALLGAPPAFATDVYNDGGDLRIDGDPDDDAITISADATTVTVTDTGTGGATEDDTDPADCTQVSPTTVTCQRAPSGGDPIDYYQAGLGSGTDTFVNQAAVDVFRDGGELFSQAGVKTIQGGPASETLSGGPDSDVIRGGEGDDFLLGGTSSFANQTAGNDTLFGEGGVDGTRYEREATAAGVTVSLDGIANDGQAGEADNVDVEEIETDQGDDVVIGNASLNVIETRGGNDQIFALGGPDLVFAGRDDDLVVGGDGDDELYCGLGFDIGLLDSGDDPAADCERTGAGLTGDSSAVDKKRRFKVAVDCPAGEGAPCVGKLKVIADGRKLGKGKFNVPAGKTKNAKAKLTKKGAKALRSAGGSLLVVVQASTTEPGGVSQDESRILLHG